MSQRPQRVLHVMIRAGAGQASAAQTFIAATPEYEHHFLYARDVTCELSVGFDDLAASATDMALGWFARARQLRQLVTQLQPAVIHAHSSFAGALTRASLARKWRRRLVYTPHGYAFFRRDVAFPVRLGFWLAEAALGARGGQVAACSPHEAVAARRLVGRRRVHFAPNALPATDVCRDAGAWGALGVVSVVAAGRLAPQKAPELFAAAASGASALPYATSWTWVGGGDAALAAMLADAGVQVTGWLPQETVQQQLAAADIFVHTAAWESAPMTVLEAARIGLPVLARDIPPLRALGLAPLWKDLTQLLALLAQFPDGAAPLVARRSAATLLERHAMPNLRAGLLSAYSAATRNVGR